MEFFTRGRGWGITENYSFSNCSGWDLDIVRNVLPCGKLKTCKYKIAYLKTKTSNKTPMFFQLKGQPWEDQIDFVSFAKNHGTGKRYIHVVGNSN